MPKKTKDKKFIKKPTYIGGLKAMRQFIAKEMRYPKSALDQKIEGSVFLKYEVDYKGEVIASRVLSSLGYGCDEEAKRIVSKLKFYVGKNPRKLRIKFNKSIRIKFRLPKKKVKTVTVKPHVKKEAPSNAPRKIVYTVTPSPKKKENPKSNSGGYRYTIKIN